MAAWSLREACAPSVFLACSEPKELTSQIYPAWFH